MKQQRQPVLLRQPVGFFLELVFEAVKVTCVATAARGVFLAGFSCAACFVFVQPVGVS